MPIHVYWADEGKTLLQADFVETYTWDEYHDAIEKQLAMIEGLPHRFVSITNLTDLQQMPSAPFAPHFRRNRVLTPLNEVMTIIVGASADLRLLTSDRTHVNTLDEAYALAREMLAGTDTSATGE